jgi:release factor glutamine methyltransferase
MKIKSNKVQSVINYFNDELKGLYPKEEIQNFIFFSFQHFLNYNRIDLIINKDNTLSESELLKFMRVVKELKNSKPIQYILGETIFYGLKFTVSPDVLIPRPETEELVDWIINSCKKHKQNTPLKILDIGTGSGCIPITLKHHLPNNEVHALDVSQEALNIATKNAQLNKVNVNFKLQDILILTAEDITKYDIIISNPPYVCRSESQYMFKNVLDFEPHLALFVEDNDALKFYKAICNYSQSNLNNGGFLYFEINEHFEKEIIKLLTDNGFQDIESKKDIRGKERMVRGRKI